MNKETIDKLIIEKRDQIKSINEKIDTLNSQGEEIIIEYTKKLDSVNTHLINIEKELEEEKIPESFYNKIYNNILELNTRNIFNFLNTPNYQINVDTLKRNIQICPLNTERVFVNYNFYKDLGFLTENTVVVGSNGSGKSTLAEKLKITIDEKDGIVIPAQKLLIIPTLDNIPTYDASIQKYRTHERLPNNKVTYRAPLNSLLNSELQKHGLEFNLLLSTLIAEKSKVAHDLLRAHNNGLEVSKINPYNIFDHAIKIWNSLIENKEMIFDGNKFLIKYSDDGRSYDAYKMSDGEKIIFYFIGRILLAKENSLIIIDEPEMHLHKAIVNKLWDKLEFLRKDCIFVYLTHDLDFASSRKAQKYWIQNFEFEQQKWWIKSIPENEIPENLLLKLLGSKKRILFCEGKKKDEKKDEKKDNSLDIKIFEILFPDYTITPVESCTNVINYVRAFNKIPNKNVEAIGLIDRDFRTEEQLKKCEDEKIYSYSVAEIENLFLMEKFILKFAEYKNEPNFDFNKLKKEVLNKLSTDKQTQAAHYVSSLINYNFSESHVKKGNNLKSVQDNLDIFVKGLTLTDAYNTRIKKIKEIILTENYQEAIMVYNNKGLLSIAEKLFGFTPSAYRNKAFDFLKNDNDAKEILKSAFPNHL